MKINRHVLTGAVVTALASFSHAASAAGTCSVADFTNPAHVAVTGTLSDFFIDDQCEYLYATNKTANRLEVYSIKTKTLLPPIQVGSLPNSIDASPDGKSLYVANSGGRNFSVISTSQHVETRKVSMPSDQDYVPWSIAVASNGHLFMSTNYAAASEAGGSMYEYNPTTDAFTVRRDFNYSGTTPYPTTLKASGDRKVIGITTGEVHRYDVATDAFRKSTRDQYGTQYGPWIALDQTGDVILVNGRDLFDSDLNHVTTIPGTGRAVVTPDGKFAYYATRNAVVKIDLTTYQVVATIPATGAGIGLSDPIAMSPDGTLLAVRNTTGFTILRTDGNQTAPPLRVMALSTAQTRAMSFFRFYNANYDPGMVKVTLLNLATGEKLVEWTSPIIAGRTAPQFSVRDIEMAATRVYDKPYYYQAIIEPIPYEDYPIMTGTFAHAVWSPSDNILTNLSTCDSGVDSVPDRLVNVHSSNLDYAYPSFVSIMNTSAAPIRFLNFYIYDAKTGKQLGNYYDDKTVIPVGAGQVLSVDEIEKKAHITPTADQNHYVIDTFPIGSITGYFQHLVNNTRSGVLTDMSTVCRLPQL